MAGFGFELTFLWIMVSIRAFCIFCIFNAAVIAGWVWASFDPSRIWQSATVALFFFMSSNHLISRENTSQISQEQAEAPESAVATVNGETIIPTFIINGKMISGKLSYDGFKQKIDEALNASQKRIYGS